MKLLLLIISLFIVLPLLVFCGVHFVLWLYGIFDKTFRETENNSHDTYEEK